MLRKFSIPAVAGTLVLVAALALPSLVGGVPAAVRAQSSDLPRTITVVGEGKATGEPDQAVLNVGVETTAASVKEAMDQNNEIMEAIMETLAGLGIEESDIRTANFSIYVERQPQMFGEGMRIPTEAPEMSVIYHVNNTVLITVRDLDSVSTVLEEVTGAGANSIWGINFSISDTTALQSEARAAAVANARARAEELAELNGVSVGQVISISEVVGSVPSYLLGTRQEMAAGLGGGGAPISPGQLEYAFQVQITYTIE